LMRLRSMLGAVAIAASLWHQSVTPSQKLPCVTMTCSSQWRAGQDCVNDTCYMLLQVLSHQTLRHLLPVCVRLQRQLTLPQTLAGHSHLCLLTVLLCVARNSLTWNPSIRPAHHTLSQAHNHQRICSQVYSQMGSTRPALRTCTQAHNNQAGRLAQSIRPAQHTISQVHNQVGRLARSIRPALCTLSQVYSQTGRLAHSRTMIPGYQHCRRSPQRCRLPFTLQLSVAMCNSVARQAQALRLMRSYRATLQHHRLRPIQALTTINALTTIKALHR
jgi:hypothetical protein